MMHYRISKYNPKFRDEDGLYTRKEWTSISDIGESFDGSEVTIHEYLEIENRYLKAINIILDYLKIKYLYVMELEKQGNIIDEENKKGLSINDINIINSIKEGQELNIEEINSVIKATLREIFWCGLYSKTTHIIIKPGYDFYIHIICPKLPSSIIEQINKLELYID